MIRELWERDVVAICAAHGVVPEDGDLDYFFFAGYSPEQAAVRAMLLIGQDVDEDKYCSRGGQHKQPPEEEAGY